MKTLLTRIQVRVQVVTAVLLMLAAVTFHPGVAMCAEASSSPVAAELEVQGTLKIENPITILFNLNGYSIPAGSYASININVISGPDGSKPTVKSGYPSSIITFHKPGTYSMEFILNEVSKPSCGGVNAKPLLDEQRTLQIVSF